MLNTWLHPDFLPDRLPSVYIRSMHLMKELAHKTIYNKKLLQTDRVSALISTHNVTTVHFQGSFSQCRKHMRHLQSANAGSITFRVGQFFTEGDSSFSGERNMWTWRIFVLIFRTKRDVDLSSNSAKFSIYSQLKCSSNRQMEKQFQQWRIHKIILAKKEENNSKCTE